VFNRSKTNIGDQMTDIQCT